MSKLTCPNCGYSNPADYKFCGNCGAALVASSEDRERLTQLRAAMPRELAQRAMAAREGERRQVTILFADVVGSTALAEKRDPEETKVILEECLTLLMEQVHRFEGYVGELMGDGLLAFFGAPITHEDDPERAVRAALGIQESIGEYAEEFERAYGVSMQVRVGINTGMVVVGGMGSDLRMEYTAVGDAVNLASRVQGAAPPGGVLITESTYQLVSRLFEFASLGEIRVKGREEAMEVYLVTGAITEPGKVRGVEGLRSPLVGRDQELKKLKDALEDLSEGKGQVAVVMGEPGIGKTRLVEEVREAFADRDILWLEGRPLSYGQSLSLWIFQDVIRRYFGIFEGDSPAMMRVRLRSKVRALFPEREEEILPYLAGLLSVKLEGEMVERVAGLHPEAIKRRIFVVVGILLERIAEEQPVAVVLEDLHWADPTSVDLLKGLLASAERAPILFCLVARPYRDQPWWSAKVTAQTEYPRLYTEIVLQPLPEDDASQLVENLLQIEELPRGFKSSLLERTQGNPFFLEEVLRALIQEGVLVRQNGRWRATARVLSVEIPDTVQAVIRARIDRLEDGQKQVLQIASVIGKSFLHRVLEGVARMEWELEAHLAALERQELILEKARKPEREYIFRHDLTQEVVYDGLLLETRKSVHRRVAEAIEALFPDRLEEFYGMLGHHWSEAEEAERAVKYLLRAGDRARLAYATEEAEAYYNRALFHLRDAGEDEEKAKTLMKLGLVYHISGDYGQMAQCYEEAFRMWRPAALALGGRGKTLRLPQSRWFTYGVNLGFLRGVNPGQGVWEGTMALFEGLVRHDAEGNVVPACARSWEISEGGTRYLFHLRSDLRWSDGRPVTAGDFEYAWKRNLHPTTAGPLASYLYPVKEARSFHRGETDNPERVGVRALDETTLEVRLEVPTAYFLHLVATWVTYPLPRHAIEAYGESWTEPGKIVTNGLFVLSEHTPGVILTLERNPLYLGPFPGNLDRVEWIFVDDVPQGLDLFGAGEVDASWVPPDWVGQARYTYPKEITSSFVLSTKFLGFDVTRPPFDDPRVRRAFVHAANREELAKIEFEQPAKGGVVPPGLAGHSAEIGLRHDPEKARRLLKEAGYPNGAGFPTVRFTAKGRPETTRILVSQWQDELGVNIYAESSVPIEDPNLTLRQDPPHIFFFRWNLEYPDPDNILRVLFHGSSPLNYTGWRSEEFDRLVEQAARLSDQAQRMALYQQADEILVGREVVVMPLVYHRHHDLAKPWVRGFRTNLLHKVDLREVVVEPH